MPEPSDVLVLGHGPAAHRLVERLRHHGHRGRVTVLTAGRSPAHQRALLPAALAGPLPRAALVLPAPPDGVAVHHGRPATAIDRDRRVVRDAAGVEHAYRHLVLATGTAPRDPGFAPGRRTHTPHGLDDLDDLRGVDGDVVVVGGGRRGVELAVTLARRGVGARVDLVEAGPYPLARHLDAGGGAAVTAVLGHHGVTVHAGRRAVARTDGALVLRAGSDGEHETIAAPDVVLATGREPATRLARGCGLGLEPGGPARPGGTGAGVRVDDTLTTTDPRVHALGAVTSDGTDLGAAHAQADVLARRLAGRDARHRRARPTTRLRVGDLDVLALGTPPGPGAGRDGATGSSADAVAVTAHDPSGTRHAHLELVDDRVVRAVVVGFPAASGPLVQHWLADRPLPDARLALLLGTAPATGSADPAELDDDAVVCVCNSVTRGALAHAHAEGADTVEAIAAATRATTGCGTCRSTVCRLLEVLDAPAPSRDEEVVA